MITGNEALRIVDNYRERVEDASHIEALEKEFPSYAQLLGAGAVLLFRADLNKTGAFKWRGAIVGATALAEQGVGGGQDLVGRRFSQTVAEPWLNHAS